MSAPPTFLTSVNQPDPTGDWPQEQYSAQFRGVTGPRRLCLGFDVPEHVPGTDGPHEKAQIHLCGLGPVMLTVLKSDPLQMKLRTNFNVKAKAS